jgi:anti-sigma B factor antagonist
MMEIAEREFKRCAVIEVSGRIDSATAPDLAEVLHELTEEGQYNLVLDMGDVDFISSAGLRVLIDTQKTAKRLNRGKLVLADVPEPIYEAFDLAGFVPLFDFYDEQVEAVGSF